MKGTLLLAWDNRFHAKEHNSYIVDEDFQKVKVQLMALGLIKQIGPAKWLLTDYGVTVLRCIAAIRSEKAASIS